MSGLKPSAAQAHTHKLKAQPSDFEEVVRMIVKSMWVSKCYLGFGSLETLLVVQLSADFDSSRDWK